MKIVSRKVNEVNHTVCVSEEDIFQYNLKNPTSNLRDCRGVNFIFNQENKCVDIQWRTGQKKNNFMGDHIDALINQAQEYLASALGNKHNAQSSQRYYNNKA